MSIAYRCDPQLGCTFVIWDGRVTPEVWRGHFDQLFADPAFPPGRRWLIDLRTAGEVSSITEDVIAEIGKRINLQSERLDQMQVAVIPNGMWEQASQLVDHEISLPGLRSILFNDPSVACGWLGLSVGDVQPISREPPSGPARVAGFGRELSSPPSSHRGVALGSQPEQSDLKRAS